MTSCVIVPCYNEAARLPVDVFGRFIEEDGCTGFVFVDDGSTDATLEVLRSLQGYHPDAVHVIAKEQNAGKAEAVRTGVMHCLENPAIESIGYWDADLATPLDEIPRFKAALIGNEGVEFVLGSRVKRLGADIDRHVWRHYLGRIFATAASLTLDLGVYDTQCGAKLMTRRLAEVAFAEPFMSPWLFDVEIIARLMQSEGPDVVRRLLFELPLRQWHDIEGSKIKLSYYLKAPFELWRISRRYRAGGEGK